jgi:hypothetical protein
MSARNDPRYFSLGRFFLSACLVFAILAAAALSVSPGLHERLHPDASSTHLCLVTLFASGQCESATAAPIAVAAAALPFIAILPLPALSFLPAAHFFSLLEHAPPALA